MAIRIFQGGGGSAVPGSMQIVDSFNLLTARVGESIAAQTEGELAMIKNATFEEDTEEGSQLLFHNSSTAQAATTTTTRSINRPTATVDGDLLIAILAFTATAGLTITPPAGWTALGSVQQVTDTVLGLVLTTQAFAKIASSEPGSWTWTTSANHLSDSGSVLAYTGGQIPTNFSYTSGGNDNRSQAQTYSGVTGDVNGREFLVALMSITQTHSNDGWSIAPPNVIERLGGSVSASGNNNSTHDVWSGLKGSTSAITKKTESDVWISFSAVLKKVPIVIGEAVQLRINGVGDSNSTPTEARNATLRVWLSGSAVDSTNGVTNVANMDSANNAAVATFQSAVAGDANPRTHSALGSNIGTISFSTAVFRCWFKSVNTLITSTTKLVMHSTTAAFADITMFSNVALNTTVDHLTGDFTFDLIAAGVNTLAKLQSCQLIASTQDAVAGVTPAVLTVDAGAIDITGAL